MKLLRNLLILVPTLAVFGSPWYHHLAYNNLVAACGEDCHGGGGEMFVILLLIAASGATFGIAMWLREQNQRNR
jgi:hypothetical protein